MNFQPIIIIGAARSGTNMLRDLLVELPNVATWPCDEINYIWRHHNASHSSDEFTPDLASQRVTSYVRRAFAAQAKRTGAEILIEKTCANSLRVRFVRRIFPTAKFIFIVRDGRDVVASALRRWKAPLDLAYVARKARFVPQTDIAYYASRYLANRLHRLTSWTSRLSSWGPQFEGMQEMLKQRPLAEVCAEQWRRCVLSAATALNGANEKTVCSVRYESLVNAPQQELGRVLDFVGAPHGNDEVASLAKHVVGTSVNKWKLAEDARAIARLQPVVADVNWQLGMLDGEMARIAA